MPFQQILRKPHHVLDQGNNLIPLPGMTIDEQTRRAGRSRFEDSLACATRNCRHDLNRRNLSDDD